MREKIFNVFLFMGEDQIIREIGMVCHDRSESDEEKLAFLQDKVNDDFRLAKRHPLPDWCVLVEDGKATRGLLSLEAYHRLVPMMMHMEILEPIFETFDAPAEPLMVQTCVVNGHPRIDEVVHCSTEPSGGAGEIQG